MNENRTGKYLKYALGEILLVMIGILLALQVNNWNENRKVANLELGIIEGLRNDLTTNIEYLNLRISDDSLVVARAEQLINMLEDKSSIYVDSIMNPLFGGIESWVPIHPRKLSYSNLQTKGLNLISNDSLRSNIVSLYDHTYLLWEDGEKMMIEIFSNGQKIIHRYLETPGENVFRKKPNDFQAIKNSNEFKNYLTHLRALRRQLMLVFRSNIKASTLYVRNQIDEEIKRLKEL